MIERWRQGHAGSWGIYHLTAQGETSWYGFAEEIGRHLQAQGKPCARIEAIPSSAYPTPAQRPLNSRLDCSHLRQQWQVSQPDWREALRECLA
ncbi:dTDP-4-dehydrorhamnose reductase [compost metagenome]